MIFVNVLRINVRCFKCGGELLASSSESSCRFHVLTRFLERCDQYRSLSFVKNQSQSFGNELVCQRYVVNCLYFTVGYENAKMPVRSKLFDAMLAGVTRTNVLVIR